MTLITETIEQKEKQTEDELSEIKQSSTGKYFKMLKETRDPTEHTGFAGKLFKSGLIRNATRIKIQILL